MAYADGDIRNHVHGAQQRSSATSKDFPLMFTTPLTMYEEDLFDGEGIAVLLCQSP
jgi:hypothetical protein